MIHLADVGHVDGARDRRCLVTPGVQSVVQMQEHALAVCTRGAAQHAGSGVQGAGVRVEYLVAVAVEIELVVPCRICYSPGAGSGGGRERPAFDRARALGMRRVIAVVGRRGERSLRFPSGVEDLGQRIDRGQSRRVGHGGNGQRSRCAGTVVCRVVRGEEIECGIARPIAVRPEIQRQAFGGSGVRRAGYQGLSHCRIGVKRTVGGRAADGEAADRSVRIDCVQGDRDAAGGILVAARAGCRRNRGARGNHIYRRVRRVAGQDTVGDSHREIARGQTGSRVGVVEGDGLQRRLVIRGTRRTRQGDDITGNACGNAEHRETDSCQHIAGLRIGQRNRGPAEIGAIHIRYHVIDIGNRHGRRTRTGADEVGRVSGPACATVQIECRRIVDGGHGNRGRRHAAVVLTVIDYNGQRARRRVRIFRGVGIRDGAQGDPVVLDRGGTGQRQDIVVRTRQAVSDAGRNRSDRQDVTGLPVGQRNRGARQIGRIVGEHLIGIGDPDCGAIFRERCRIAGTCYVAVEIKHRGVVYGRDVQGDCTGGLFVRRRAGQTGVEARVALVIEVHRQRYRTIGVGCRCVKDARTGRDEGVDVRQRACQGNTASARTGNRDTTSGGGTQTACRCAERHDQIARAGIDIRKAQSGDLGCDILGYRLRRRCRDGRRVVDFRDSDVDVGRLGYTAAGDGVGEDRYRTVVVRRRRKDELPADQRH